jgi:hypothetical protein
MAPPLSGRTIRTVGDYTEDVGAGGQYQGGTPYNEAPGTPGSDLSYPALNGGAVNRPGIVQNNVYGRPTGGEQAAWFGGGGAGPAWGSSVNDRIGRGGQQTQDPGLVRQPWRPATWQDSGMEGTLYAGGAPGGAAAERNGFGTNAPDTIGQAIHQYSSSPGGVPSQPAPGGPPLAPAVGAGGGRPWWMNYGLQELAALPPEMVAQLPDEVLNAFGNEVYTQNPALLNRLSPEAIQGRGFAPEFLQGLQGGAPGTYAQGHYLPTLDDMRNAGLLPGPLGAATTPIGPGGYQPGLSASRPRFQGGVRPPSAWQLQGLSGTDLQALTGSMGLMGNQYAWQDYLRRRGIQV